PAPNEAVAAVPAERRGDDRHAPPAPRLPDGAEAGGVAAVKRLDPEELAWARECALAGDTLHDLAEMAGVPAAELAPALAAAGIRLRDPEARPLSPREAYVAARYQDGAFYEQIGREIGRSRTLVYFIVNR